MRPSGKSRNRNKNNARRPNPGNVINRVFDSAGPEGKVRGTPQQIIDKYQTLAHDSQLSGDRVSAENFQQHSEHYARLLLDAQREIAEKAIANDNTANENFRQSEKTNSDLNNGKVISDVAEVGENQEKETSEQRLDTN
ncbi:DUF4167 domain-containing protein [Paracoccaceae bacterium]|nr:DUF4167 domain-containing protein [Paracoccaceae bacterium]